MNFEYILGMKAAIGAVCQASCSQDTPCEAPCFTITALLLAGGPELLAMLGLPSEVDYHPTFTTRLEKLQGYRRDRDRLCGLIEDLVNIMERSDREEFDETVVPVTNGEWFEAIAEAKKVIGKGE